MAKKATKKAIEQLQKIFDIVGEYGGTIKTKKPENWWDLDLEVKQVNDTSKDIMIGVFKSVNGDILFDPQFNLTLKMDGGKIVEAEIHNCINQTILGSTEIDSDDMLHGFGMTEKAPTGLRNSFSGFMNNMTEIGPYLTDPKKVTKYDKGN
ncbi:MAG: hypothetical protein K6E63_00100 [Lachnospiraceae bacterium]|nr:hypothetical protein [Lachnospiraceae bacterium]